jgi:hypothetical protein
MAKQTFTVGQVLTASQLTSLQATALGGGAASAKSASYTLVAADAGTTISMTSTSATSITVNSGLFAAGDTVFIQNLGSGNCTVTAGSATVSTAGSAILPTNDAGILYFVSTGVAIFYDFIQTGAVSPLTTKGDLYGFSTLDARIPIGANGTLLTADSSESLGLKWAAPAGGGGKVLQVVYATYGTQVNSTTSTYADTNLTATITPTLNTSKVLVIVNQNGCEKRATDTSMMLKLLRGATDISQMASLGGYTGTTVDLNFGSISTAVLDAPATTSATTYKTQFASNGNTSRVSVQHGDGGAGGSVSTITLLEIGA